MMISDEQVRRVAECLKADRASGAVPAPHTRPDPSLVAGIVDMLRDVPELRPDRMEHARQMIDGNMPDSGALASKLVGRVLSDSLR
ncbi:MAG: hypothetical protein JW733_00845 [Coriobacteriia bacterium]|nr:hypothetical protein [Coriobacteriia bacterium]